MTLRLQVVITSLLAAAIAGGWFWLAGMSETAQSRESSRRTQEATRVLVEPISLTEDRITIRAVGTGEAQRSAQIHPSVDGEVVGIAFRAGQRVAKGDVLMRLDDEHQRLAVDLVEVALAKAKRDVARLRKLAKAGHTTQVSLETAQTELRSATVRLALARAELADRTIRAPFAGIVGLTDIDVGDRVSEDSMIATLDDRSALLVDFTVPEEYARRVRVGDPITVVPSTEPGREMEGTIFETGSRIDTTSRTLKVRARIPNPGDAIRPGTSFRVSLTFTGEAYPVVREVAVLWSRDGAYLWRVAQGRAERVFVKLVRRDRGRILVDGPLREGDLVVVEGVQGLRQRQLLDPAPYSETETSGGAAKDAGRGA